MLHTQSSRSVLPRQPRPVATVASECAVTRLEHAHLPASPFAWPSKFYNRHDIAYEWENTAWALNEKLEHHLESPGDVMCFILRTDEDSARYEGRIRPILDICHDVKLEDLLAGDLSGPCRKMGWVIDGYYREEKQDPWTLRRPRGALSARDLVKLLLEKRYVTFSADDNELDDPQAINAERRLIYVTDIDSWGILALIMASPESQARLLAGFLQRHLCARSSIGVSIAADGPSIFALDFHIPFRVWRTTDELLCDPRAKASNGRPLRTSRNMNFLMASTDNLTILKVHGIYSGHVGCLITGYDQWRWTAILSIDTWFNSGEGATDKVERYQFDLEDGMLLDPLGGGQDDAEKPIWEPRAYFLRVMLLRLGQVADEWELVRNNLETGVTNLAQRQKQLFLRLRPFSTGSGPEEYGQEFEGFEAYLRDLKEILQELLHDLYETLKIGEGFLSTEVNYFRNDEGSPGDASECYPSLSGIRRIFNELSQLYTVFISLKERCDDMAQNCEEARRKYFFQGISSPTQDLILHRHRIPETLSDVASHQKDHVQTRLDLANLTSEVKETRIETIRKAQEHHQSIHELQVEATRFAKEYYEQNQEFQDQLIRIARQRQENQKMLKGIIEAFHIETACLAKKSYEHHLESQAELIAITKEKQENIRVLQASFQEFQVDLKRVSEESRKNIVEVRVLAWDTFILASPFLASALFSAEGAMPFPQNPTSFSLTLVVISIAMVSIHWTLKWLMGRTPRVPQSFVNTSLHVPSQPPGHELDTGQAEYLAIVPMSRTRVPESTAPAQIEEYPAMTTIAGRISAGSANDSSVGTEGIGKTSWCTSIKRRLSLRIRQRSKQMSPADPELGLVVPTPTVVPA